MHAGLVFHYSVHALAAELEHDLLEAAGSARGLVGHLEFPPAALGEMLVHAEEVAGENGRLVAAGAAADLDDGILGIVGVCGDEQQFQVLLHPGDLRLEFGNLLTGHLAELVILLIHEDVLGGCHVVEQLLVLEPRLDDGFEFLVVLVELDELLHVGHHVRAGELLLQRCELVLQGQYLVQKFILCHNVKLSVNVAAADRSRHRMQTPEAYTSKLW